MSTATAPIPVVVPDAPAVEPSALADPSDLAAAPAAAASSAVTAPPAGSAPERRPVGRRAWLPVAAAMVAVAWGGNEFTPLLVMYRQVSEFSALIVDGLLAAYILGIVPALLLGGPLSDLHGRRALMIPAAPLSFAGSLLLALNPGAPLLLALGRILCGLALGLVMAVGTAWVKELSDAAASSAATAASRASGASAAPGASSADAGAGPRRASLSLTGGFLVGAGVAAVLAQWAPWPTGTAYAVHMLLTAVTGIWVLTAPETRVVGRRSAADGRRGLRGVLSLLRVPSAAHRRFLMVVLPVAPWVFGCAGAAYAVLPSLLMDSAHGLPIAFSGLMTALTLGCGAGIQVLGKRIDTHRSARASVIAMAVITVGVALGAIAATTLDLPVGLLAAATMGMGYGLALVAGLSEVQRIADEDDLAGLTAVYYSVSYLGFFIPMIFAALSLAIPYPVLFGIGTVLAAVCLAIVASAWSKHLPGPRR
ncbi:MFS transporter [Brachybacterium sp. DNPG3]